MAGTRREDYREEIERLESEIELLHMVTIERCAQVAENYKPQGLYVAKTQREIAAAIRKLKDE